MLDLESSVSGSIPTRGIILSLDFLFSHSKPLMPILALLPMLCICENLDWHISLIFLKHRGVFFKLNFESKMLKYFFDLNSK